MKAVISFARLALHRPCNEDYRLSPEWHDDHPEHGAALVYEDLGATIERLLATETGRAQLAWLARKRLLPMPPEELAKLEARAALHPQSKLPYEPPTLTELAPDDPRVTAFSEEPSTGR
jgi:hypothetical protein